MKRILVSVLVALSLCAGAFAQDRTGNFVDAVSLYTSGEYTRAARALSTLSQADPSNDAVWYYLGMANIALNKTELAEECLRKAVSLDGKNFWYRRTLARLLFTLGKTEEGTLAYESIVKDFPERSQLNYELLDIYLRTRSFEKALTSLDEVERLGKYGAVLRVNLHRRHGQGVKPGPVNLLDFGVDGPNHIPEVHSLCCGVGIGR